MVRILLAVAALLLTNLAGVAAAAEHPEHKSNNARKALVVLAQIGIDRPEIIEFVKYVDGKVVKGRLQLAEQRVMGGTLSLGYNFTATNPYLRKATKGLVLKYAPDNSRWEYTAGTRAVLINYRLRF